MNELHVTFDGRSYAFQPGQTVLIGRLPDNSIVISDPTVSRRHAQLTWGPAGWLFETVGQARAFQHAQEVQQVIVRTPIELSLASPQGPMLRLGSLDMRGSQATSQAGPQTAPAGTPSAAPRLSYGPPLATDHPAVTVRRRPLATARLPTTVRRLMVRSEAGGRRPPRGRQPPLGHRPATPRARVTNS